MKISRWLFALAILAISTAASFADGLDGSGKVVRGVQSTAITQQNQQINFTACNGSTSGDCGLFQNTQFVFGGLNETGTAWSTLFVTLNNVGADVNKVVGCETSDLFLAVGGDCGKTIQAGQTSVTLAFFQNGGSGIGCFSDSYVNNPSLTTLQEGNNYACLANSNQTRALGEVYDYASTNYTCPAGLPATAVCGSNDFAIGLGFTDPNNPNAQPWNSTITTGTVAFQPEPSTMYFGGGATLAMVLFGLLRRRALAL